MPQEKARSRGRPPKAGPYVKQDWELLIQMWPLVEGQGLPVTTAANRIVASMKSTAAEKNAAVNRLRQKFRRDREQIRAEIERRRSTAQQANRTKGDQAAASNSSQLCKNILSHMDKRILAAHEATKLLHQSNLQKSLRQSEKILAAIAGGDKSFQERIIGEALENARAGHPLAPGFQAGLPRRGK